MAKAYLGLGGNVGDTKAYFAQAVEKLKAIGTVEKISSFYKTEPMGFREQAWFLNCALILGTELSPQEFLMAIKNIEQEIGRTPTVQNGPREIDIDVLLYENLVIKTETLTIPHPRMHERGFVLAPLSEIAPGVIHPVLKKTIAQLLFKLHDRHLYEKMAP